MMLTKLFAAELAQLLAPDVCHEHTARHAVMSVAEDATLLVKHFGCIVCAPITKTAFLQCGDERNEIVDPSVPEHIALATATPSAFERIFAKVRDNIAFTTLQELSVSTSLKIVMFKHEPSGTNLQLVHRTNPRQIFPDLFLGLQLD